MRALLFLALLGFAAAVSHAAAVNWELQGVTFSDGGLGRGTFVFETNTGSFLDWNIETSPTGAFGGFSYTPATSAAANSANCTAGFFAHANSSQFLCLNPGSPLGSGATSNLLPGSLESYASGVRAVASGSLTDPPPGGGESVPEPATISLAALALAVAGWIRLNRPGSSSLG